MSKHGKPLNKKQKIIVYASAAAASIIAAIIVVIVLVHIVNNPPPVILDSNSTSYNSIFSSTETSSNIKIQKPINDDQISLLQGIKNGTIYYTTQYAYITDKNVKSVTINGQEENLNFYITGNATNMYVIEITDSNGSITTYVVYTKPISTLLEPIIEFSNLTVTADNYDTINNVKNTVLKLDTRYSTPSETNEINDIISICDTFINRIDAVSDDINNVTKVFNKYKEKELETSDSHNINKLILDIDELLSSNNITSNQRNALQKMKSSCQSWMTELSPNEYVTEFME